MNEMDRIRTGKIYCYCNNIRILQGMQAKRKGRIGRQLNHAGVPATPGVSREKFSYLYGQDYCLERLRRVYHDILLC
jgi:hypothetical protein